MSDSQLLTFESGPVATNGYLLISSGSAMIVDAPMDAGAAMIAAMEAAGVTPELLLLTHSHWDHVADAALLLRRYPAMRAFVHQADEYRLADPMAHTVWRLPFTIEPVRPNAYFKDGDEVEFAGKNFRVLHTPGHTEGSVCLYDAGEGLVFAGDTLFAGSVGRTDLPGGSWEILLNSINKQLLTLPDDVRVLPGHGEPTTIETERESNPFL